MIKVEKYIVEFQSKDCKDHNQWLYDGTYYSLDEAIKYCKREQESHGLNTRISVTTKTIISEYIVK